MARTATTDDIAEKATTVAKDVQEAGREARRMAADQVEALRETASQYFDESRSRVREIGETVQHRVQEQPLASVLIATAVGFLLGVIWVRR
jgi:ElaB/YqjD/DUF883 family membrane-anchored ribosome-binding protein